MSDHDALLHAIAEHPEEDTPRLMYADWLEEYGDPDRADFARNQIALAQPGINAAERYPLVKKNVFYLNNWVPHWKAQLPRLDGIIWGDFNRGLIEEVQAESESRVVNYAAAVFAVPGIHILRLRRLRNGAALARLPEVARLRALKMVSARAGAAAVRALLVSPHLGRLRVLDLHDTGADDAVAADLAAGRFPELTELWLGSNVISDAGAFTLANALHLPTLQLLDLRNNFIADHATRAMLLRHFGTKVKL